MSACVPEQKKTQRAIANIDGARHTILFVGSLLLFPRMPANIQFDVQYARFFLAGVKWKVKTTHQQNDVRSPHRWRWMKKKKLEEIMAMTRKAICIAIQ